MKIDYVWIYLASMIAFLGVDSIWLKTMTSRFYQPRIGHLLSDTPNMLAASIFYLFYILALCILVIYPQVKLQASLQTLFLYGALIGLMAYGTFDFTSLALFENYSISVTLVDFIWGGVLTGSVCLVVGWLSYYFKWLA